VLLRSLALDDTQTMREVQRHQNELEAITYEPPPGVIWTD
jgi:hypothetical protein